MLSGTTYSKALLDFSTDRLYSSIGTFSLTSIDCKDVFRLKFGGVSLFGQVSADMRKSLAPISFFALEIFSLISYMDFSSLLFLFQFSRLFENLKLLKSECLVD